MTLGQKEASLGLFLTLSTNRNISSKSCTLTSGIWFKQYCQSKQSISCLNVCCTSFKKGLAGWNFHENLSWNLHFYCNLTGKYLNACSHEALLHCRQEGQHWTEVIHTSKREQGIFFKHLVLSFLCFLHLLNCFRVMLTAPPAQSGNTQISSLDATLWNSSWVSKTACGIDSQSGGIYSACVQRSVQKTSRLSDFLASRYLKLASMQAAATVPTEDSRCHCSLWSPCQHL